MTTYDDFTDDWTPEEQALLASLPNERIPPAGLKIRTASAVRDHVAASVLSAGSRRRAIGLVAAATVIFATGTLVGYLTARRSMPANGQRPVAVHNTLAKARQDTLKTNQMRYVIWY
jgi:hypothetical protein